MPTGLGWRPNPRDRASPTGGESAAATRVAALESQPDLAKSPYSARLAVVSSKATVFTSGGIQIRVQQAQAANIQVGDVIAVAELEGQNEQSYSILHFPDFLNVELFRKTKVFLADVESGAGGSTDVTLDLDSGHIFVHLNEQTNSRVMVQTPYTTIEALTPGSEFDVCRTGELTCVVVKRGIVEVTTRNRKELVRAGEAGQILKDQPPSPPICASILTITDWEERYREFATTPALHKEISALPQKPCPVTAAGIPLNARIRYRNEFTSPASGWARGKIDDFMVRYVRYSGRRYYEVQVQAPNNQYLAFVPDKRNYGDINIDIRAILEAGSSGDFRYGMVFRWSGNHYYAFAISPVSKTWYFLKNSSDGLEVLEKGKDERMRGLEAKEALRVEAYGSTFLVFINGRFIYSISDSDYASGEVGLFVETFDSADALIRFDSITLWDVPPEPLIPVTGPGENCFNTIDDDGDGWTDQADPDCQSPEITLSLTSLPLPTNTLRPTNTRTLRPTNTPRPTLTLTSRPTNTRRPTFTPTPQPTSTRRPTSTPVPQPTNTRRPTPTLMPQPTDTLRPAPTPTPRPTDPPLPTNTTQPEPTNTEQPEPSATEEPTATNQPPLPTLPLPTLPLPTLPLPTLPLPTLPLPALILPLPIVPPGETPTPE